MKIHVYTYFWNEAVMLRYFMRHYSALADWIFCYDQNSTDGSASVVRQYKNVSLFSLPIRGMRDTEFIEFSQKEYKFSRGIADWIIWVDVDEFIYHPCLRNVLERYLKTGVEVPLVQGIQMISTKFPTGNGQIYDEIKTGFPSDVFDKPCVFQPKMEMKWQSGKHKLMPGFKPKRSPLAELKLLHYRFLSPQYVKERNMRNWNRMDEPHRKGGHNWTCKPGYTGVHSLAWYMGLKDRKYENVI